MIPDYDPLFPPPQPPEPPPYQPVPVPDWAERWKKPLEHSKETPGLRVPKVSLP